jgi:hypothetical protein
MAGARDFCPLHHVETSYGTDRTDRTSVGTGGCLQGVQQPGHEAACTPQSSARVKMEWIYTSTPPIHPRIFMVYTRKSVPQEWYLSLSFLLKDAGVSHVCWM